MNGGAPIGGPNEPYPGPVSALFLTFCAVLLTGFVIGALGLALDPGVVGIAEAVGLGVTGSLAARRIAPPHPQRLGLRGFDPNFGLVIVLLLPLIILGSELDNVMRSEPATIHPPWTDAPALSQIQLVIVAIALIPVVEEWFFRGVLQQGLVARLGPVGGVLFTSGLYAMVRFAPASDPGAAGAAFLTALALGGVLGLLRLATGSVLAPMLLSAGFWSVLLLAEANRETFPLDGFTAPGTHTSWNVLLPSMIAVGWGITQLLAALREAPVGWIDEPSGDGTQDEPPEEAER